MLNRRILRVKVMQALYSYYTTRESLKEVVKEHLEGQFYPDPAKDDFSESDKFAARRKEASRLFIENLPAAQVPTSSGTPEIDAAVNNAIRKYYDELSTERRKIASNMTGDLDRIQVLYLKLLAILPELSHIERQEREKRLSAHVKKTSDWRWHFIDNPLIDDLTKNEAFNKALIDRKISWSEETLQLKDWYKDILKQDDTLKTYQAKESPTQEEHKEAVVYLFKKIIFKNETIGDYLAESDIHWDENKSVLRSLAVKTLQDYEPELDPPFELKRVIQNEDDDLDFFNKLFKGTLDADKELDELVKKYIKNWDITRVALTDRIILKMAVTEMKTFYSIPVKVTINEFIEISKQYSTPKSKQFINGILDVLANELTSEGVIRKSGRGLIDNK